MILNITKNKREVDGQENERKVKLREPLVS